MPKTIKENEISTDKTSSVEMRAELEAGLEDVKNREGAINSQKILNKNTLKEVKTKLIQSLFGTLQELGVDGSNLESINLFLTKLRSQDPDLASLFETAFSGLVEEPKEEMAVPEEGIENAGLMNQYKNLVPGTMMPRG
jgi:hypothetical protein